MSSHRRRIFIVMPFIEHDLKTLLADMPHPFLQSEVKTIMLQLLSAVAYCHANWIVRVKTCSVPHYLILVSPRGHLLCLPTQLHRDLKTSNLLMNNRGRIKVADFGLARKFGDPLGEMTQLVVTLWYRCVSAFKLISESQLQIGVLGADNYAYRSPELLLGGKEYSTAVDMWSVGCIFAELIQKEPLFPGRGEIDQINKASRAAFLRNFLLPFSFFVLMEGRSLTLVDLQPPRSAE
jgi:cell division cycle 2-like protein